MDKPGLRHLITTLVLGLLGFAWSAWAHADPPSRVARIGYASGAVSFSPGGENDWVRATVNRPMITGDRLWTDDGARAELQLGRIAVRMGARTSLTLLNLDDRIVQLQLSQGRLNLRLRHLERDQTFEVDTPNLAYSIRRPGSYRIEVDPDGRSTTVSVRAGQGEVYGEGSAFMLDEGQSIRFYDTGLRDYDSLALGPADDFDRWASERDRRWDRSTSARYVSPDLIGYEDLDEQGTWRSVQDYGNVWFPNRVPSGWAPYRDGHWAWVEPWGWTWVDDEPWGFAPSHYGRWASIDGSWAWVPGPVAARPVYAPALVAFVGGSGARISLNLGGANAVAWFPLGPRDVYRPSYAVSREYFTNVNTSSTVVSTTQVTNVYNNTNVTNVVYVNQQVPGAVVAVPTAAFTQSKPVAKAAVQVDKAAVASAPVVAVAQVAPARTSVLGAAPAVTAKPPEAVLVRAVVAKAAPPPAPVPFAAKQTALAANAGKPLDTAAVAALKPTAPAVAPPAVKVVAATPAPVALPPKPLAAASAARSPAETTAATPPVAAASTPQPRPPVASASAAEPRPPVAAASAPQPRPPAAAASALQPRPPMAAASAAVPRPPAEQERAARAPAAVPRPPDARPVPGTAAAPASVPPITAAKPPEPTRAMPPAREAELARERQAREAQPPQAPPRPAAAARVPDIASMPPPAAIRPAPVPPRPPAPVAQPTEAHPPAAAASRANARREAASEANRGEERGRRGEGQEPRRP
jgi:hypothetical protein